VRDFSVAKTKSQEEAQFGVPESSRWPYRQTRGDEENARGRGRGRHEEIEVECNEGFAGAHHGGVSRKRQNQERSPCRSDPSPEELLADNGLITSKEASADQVKCISKFCLLYIHPLLMREAKKCHKERKGISNSKLGKLRHGLAGMWEGLRNDEDAAAVELWKPMLQLFLGRSGGE
jgi:hypothetical protein